MVTPQKVFYTRETPLEEKENMLLTENRSEIFVNFSLLRDRIVLEAVHKEVVKVYRRSSVGGGKATSTLWPNDPKLVTPSPL